MIHNVGEQAVLLRLRREIDAAHQLPFHDGKCSRLHGHRFKVEFAIVGVPKPDETAETDAGMVVDFGDVKELVDRVLPDHLSLNDPAAAEEEGITVPDAWSRWDYGIANPTSERLAYMLYDVLAPQVAELRDGVRLQWVRVWETPGGDATYPARGVLGLDGG